MSELGGWGHGAQLLLLQLRLFLEQGGTVLWVLAGVSVLIWGCLVEHALWLAGSLPGLRSQARALAAHAPGPWTERLRRMVLGRARNRMERSLPLVRTLVTLCPLLGLLGTVLGMIQVFDTMAALGSADVRALSAGISRAVLTTMAGLAIALPGLYLVNRLERRIERILERLRLDSLP